MNERDFCLVLRYLIATSGSALKGDLAERIQKELPGVEPWKWAAASALVDPMRRIPLVVADMQAAIDGGEECRARDTQITEWINWLQTGDWTKAA